MKVSCPSCASQRVLVGSELSSRGFFGPYLVFLQVPPATSAFGGRATSPVATDVCVDCGNIRLRAADLSELQRAYSVRDVKPLGLDA